MNTRIEPTVFLLLLLTSQLRAWRAARWFNARRACFPPSD
jgi:hypothetical protein